MEELPPPLRGQTVVHLRYAYAGDDHAEAERLLVADEGRRARSCSATSARSGPTRWTRIHMDPVDPMPAWEKGMLLTDLTEETVDALLAAAGPQVEIPLIMAEIRLMGGALGRPAEGAERGRRPRAAPSRCCVIGPGVPELAQVVPAVGKGVLGALAAVEGAGVDDQLPR